MDKQEIVRKAVFVFLALGVFFFAWIIGSQLFPAKIPGVTVVFPLVVEIVTEPGPLGNTAIDHLQTTLVRVLIIFGAAMLLSVLIGTVMGLNYTFEDVFGNWLPFWLMLPDIVGVLSILIVFGYTDFSIVLSVVLLSTPFGIINVWEGIQDLDAGLLEMGKSFGASPKLLWQYIYIPHLTPYIFSSGRYLLGVIWKITLVAEAFGADEGIGSEIRFWFTQAEAAPIIAYLLLFFVVISVIEYGVLAPFEKTSQSWR